MLALPGGIAAFSDSKAAVVPAFGLVGALGLLSAYCFSLIGRLCVMTGTTTYKAAGKPHIQATPFSFLSFFPFL